MSGTRLERGEEERKWNERKWEYRKWSDRRWKEESGKYSKNNKSVDFCSSIELVFFLLLLFLIQFFSLGKNYLEQHKEHVDPATNLLPDYNYKILANTKYAVEENHRVQQFVSMLRGISNNSKENNLDTFKLLGTRRKRKKEMKMKMKIKRRNHIFFPYSVYCFIFFISLLLLRFCSFSFLILFVSLSIFCSLFFPYSF